MSSSIPFSAFTAFDLSPHKLTLTLSVLASQGPLILSTFIVAFLFQKYKNSLLSHQFFTHQHSSIRDMKSYLM